MHPILTGAGFFGTTFLHGIALQFQKNTIMKPNTILHADLLDILFENRNKEYGAYTLRKFYNRRLQTAIIIMIAFCIACWGISFLKKTPLDPPVVIIDRTVNPVPNFANEQPKQKPHQKAVMPVAKKASPELLKPTIVDSVNINKTVATHLETTTSLNTTDTLAGKEMEGLPAGSGGRTTKSTGTTPAVKIDKSVPRAVADVMPQYPGGVNALINFLKKNLRTPEDINEGDVSVKVQFVVNYDGTLKSFTVIQSGGNTFDNEVIRVLKKMPAWIPGKSSGENVSVYYVVPVKFTSEE